MPFVCVLCLLLLFLAALGQSWWWRVAAPNPWYGNALFFWGVFCLAVVITWPIVRSLV